MEILKGKGAVVTGAASGIGKAIATAFVEAAEIRHRPRIASPETSFPLDAYGWATFGELASRKRHFRYRGSIKIQTERPHTNVILLTKHSDADVGSPRRRFIHAARVKWNYALGNRSI